MHFDETKENINHVIMIFALTAD